MSFLKRLPIKYSGELHDVRLINFSVEKEEVAQLLPPQLKLRLVNGRAMISMVDVKLKNMRPSFLPDWLHFQYRHIAFRLLVDDSQYSSDLKGIYFLRSFTQKALMALGGSVLTNYKLQKARIKDDGQTVNLRQNGHHMSYTLSPTKVIEKPAGLRETIASLDRAYFVSAEKVHMIKIQREKWPIQWVKCTDFQTDFFKTAKLEGAFRVNEVIYYDWLPAEKISL